MQKLQFENRKKSYFNDYNFGAFRKSQSILRKK